MTACQERIIPSLNGQKEETKKERKYLPSFGELIDRATILLLKHRRIPDLQDSYHQELSDCIHDLQIIIEENDIKIDSTFILAICMLAQSNQEIWDNEKNIRQGIRGENNLTVSHSLNGIRCTCKNIIQSLINGRLDKKVDIICEDVKFPFFDKHGNPIEK